MRFLNHSQKDGPSRRMALSLLDGFLKALLEVCENEGFQVIIGFNTIVWTTNDWSLF